MLQTKIDEFLSLLKTESNLTKIASKLNISFSAAMAIATVLEQSGVIQITYPINILEPPKITFLGYPEIKSEKQTSIEDKGKKIISTYTFKADQVPVSVEIIDFVQYKLYSISLIELSIGTRIFLDQVKEILIKEVPPEASEVADVEKMIAIRNKFHQKIRQHLEQYQLGGEVSDIMAGLLLHRMFGLGEIDLINRDDLLEEIAINNSKDPIAVYHRKFGWLKTNIYMPDENSIFNYASQIARRVGRQIATLTPILDARLETGDRVCATLNPISSHGNTITIRRFARVPWTIISLIGEPAHTMDFEMAAMLWQAFHYEMNLMVVGGTASGKTSALNALASFIPPNQRIITIEDTRELMLPKYQWNWVPLLTRLPNPEGQGEVTMLDLIVTSLRMRPDRIIVGEIRKQREAEVAFEAMHTGHSVYSTFHADTAAQAIRRLTTPPINLPPTDLDTMHLLVVQFRDRRRNLRRTLEIAEIPEGTGEGVLEPNIIYRWRPRTDTWERVGEPIRFYKELNLYTGMTKEQIDKDNKKRQTILKWMVKNNINQIDEVGKIFSLYYSNPEEIYEIAQSNLSKKEADKLAEKELTKK
ncbi:MAG: type II/IV secretion system ATPase subunit [Candidatus Micrarchaeota archaeon]|nr:type II/IV secretion system ATPase subunit [Candidatus Micrarchaeota archaeon]